MSLNVVILAAGKGTRMRSSLPKVLHELAGKPLLGHVLDAARALSAANVVVVYGHGGEAVPARFRGAGAQFVLQEPQLGTGHALMQAMPHVPARGTTLVLYGDVPLTRPQTLQALLAAPDALSILTCVLDRPQGYGRIVRDAGGRILRIVEEKDAGSDEKRISEINTGILAAPSEKLRAWLSRLGNDNAQGEYYLTDIVPQAIADGTEIRTQQPHALWEVEGVNSRAQLAQLERCFQLERAYELMAQGVTLADPARFDVRGTLECAQDVFIDVGCVFEGRVSIGSNVAVGAHCVIKDSVIGAGTRIAPFSHIEGAQVDTDCRVGPYARLRPGANLAHHVHVGNFVEVKNTSLGVGSKANHLTYLGDAVIGRAVNIGAGTITCNYDGANKATTVIEDEVFVGSDTALVAPVTVGRGATIAAGTTVWKDAPADSLVLNEKTQVAKPGWQRPVKKNPR